MRSHKRQLRRRPVKANRCGNLSRQSWIRITEPLAALVLIDEGLSQTRAVREVRNPPDPI